MKNIIVSHTVTNDESTIEIQYGNTCISIVHYEFNVSVINSNDLIKYRVNGVAGWIDVTEEELDFIYSEFKRYNR